MLLEAWKTLKSVSTCCFNGALIAQLAERPHRYEAKWRAFQGISLSGCDVELMKHYQQLMCELNRGVNM